MKRDDDAGQFETEFEAYEAAMDSLHETASRQSDGLAELDETMADLRDSITEMHDAVGEYGQANAELDDAVVSLQDTATAAQSDSLTHGHRPAAD